MSSSYFIWHKDSHRYIEGFVCDGNCDIWEKIPENYKGIEVTDFITTRKSSVKFGYKFYACKIKTKDLEKLKDRARYLGYEE